MTAEPNQGGTMPSDAELFAHAMADPQPPPEQAPAAPPPPTEQQPREPSRDELGRFARSDQATQAPAAATQQPPDPPAQPRQPSPPDAEENDVPSWRHREIRLEREAFKQERDAALERSRQIEAAFMQQQRDLQQLREHVMRSQQPQKPPELPDIITDPHGYTAYLNQQWEQRFRNQEANFSFRIAHDRHGQQFEQAYGAMIQRAEHGDPSVVRAVMASPDPGSAMMNWFRRETTLSQVGDDPNAWFERQLEEKLKDQKFAGSLLERMRGGAAQAQQANGGGPVQLPPSLNSMAAAAPTLPATGDMSDSSLFDYAFRQGRTAR